MTGKEATDKYWGIINSGDISKYSAEEIQALISKLSTLGGEGPLYARTLANMQSSSKMFNLSDKLLNFNSDYYKQYASYLQKTSPQMGVNTLLAPLMAGGTGYAGGQAIANQKMQEFIRQRQDKINTGVQGFALGNLNVGANLLGQQGQLGLGYANLNEQQREFDEQNSGWNKLFGVSGSAAGSFLPGLFGGGNGGGGFGSGVSGYGPEMPTKGKISWNHPGGY